MTRRFVALVAGLLVVTVVAAGCGAAEDVQVPQTTEVASLDPAQTLTQFLAALQAAEYDGTAPYVDETQVALLASIEDTSAATFLTMVDSGLTDQVRRNFWSSFAGAIDGLEGSSAADLIITEEAQFVAGGARFARVDLRFRGDVATGTWVMRDEGGSWIVDPIATFGGAFVSPVRLWMRSVDQDDRPSVMDLVAGHRPSWEALGLLQDENSEAGVAVLAELEGLIAELAG